MTSGRAVDPAGSRCWAPQSAPIAGIPRRAWLAQMLALSAAGCARDRGPGHSRRSTVTVAVNLTDALDPNGSLNSPIALAFLPLLTLSDTGELVGRLAERWEHSPDYREWTYYLRPGVRWHDGTPVTAQDVKFSLELKAHPKVLTLGSDAFESITVVNHRTVRVRQRHFEEYSWDDVLYPKHLLEHLDPANFWGWDFWKHPVGNGPYRFVHLLPKTMMEFEANPDYYRGKPGIERVVVKFAGPTALADLRAGNVDAVNWIPPAWIPDLAGDARFRIYYSDIAAPSNYELIFWQHRDPLFQDPRVRRAMTLAIDRRELLAVMNMPHDAPLTDGPVGRWTPGDPRRGTPADLLPHDPAQARALLEAAGWHGRNGDRIREREGRSFRFTALASGPGHQKVAVYVQAQLRRVGVDMAVQMQDGVTGRIRRGEFQAAFDVVQTGRLFNMMGLKYGPNGLGYQSARVTELVHRQDVAVDPDAVERIFGELKEVFREDVPVTYLFPWIGASVAHWRLRGLHAPFRTELLRHMDELWLEDAR